MPEYLAPGVYIEEVSFRVQTIDGVDTDICAELVGTPLDRTHYFTGRMLSAADLVADQTYGRDKLRRHNRLLHGWGVVCGLLVTADATATTPWRIRIDAGIALDRRGDELTLACPVSIDLEAHRARGTRRIHVAIRYAEALVFRDGTERLVDDSETTTDADGIREAVVIGCLGDPVSDPWLMLAAVTLPASRRTRLGDGHIDTAVRAAVRGTPSG